LKRAPFDVSADHEVGQLVRHAGDGMELPVVVDSFELVRAPIVEADVRAHGQVLDRSGDEYLARAGRGLDSGCLGGDAVGPVHGGAVASATPVGGDLLGPLVRGAQGASVGPAPRFRNGRSPMLSRSPGPVRARVHCVACSPNRPGGARHLTR
jgi:hypothetical protein